MPESRTESRCALASSRHSRCVVLFLSSTWSVTILRHVGHKPCKQWRQETTLERFVTSPSGFIPPRALVIIVFRDAPRCRELNAQDDFVFGVHTGLSAGGHGEG